jgi:hypothetical protein
VGVDNAHPAQAHQGLAADCVSAPSQRRGSGRKALRLIGTGADARVPWNCRGNENVATMVGARSQKSQRPCGRVSLLVIAAG